MAANGTVHNNASSHRQLLTNGHPNGRRTSAPLMPAFMVSAPGKVIVVGEHAVVHGKVSKFDLLRVLPLTFVLSAF